MSRSKPLVKRKESIKSRSLFTRIGISMGFGHAMMKIQKSFAIIFIIPDVPTFVLVLFRKLLAYS
jgi:hypothetical protein